MAYTLYEWGTVNRAGSPVGPPTRTTGLAFASARQLASGTVYFRVVPDADCYFLLSTTGDAATSADGKIINGFGTEGEIAPGSRPYVYLTAA